MSLKLKTVFGIGKSTLHHGIFLNSYFKNLLTYKQINKQVN